MKENDSEPPTSSSGRSSHKSTTTSNGSKKHGSSPSTEQSKYETRIRESSARLTKYTVENDQLMDEISNLRLQIKEMKNDRRELVRAHQESMALLVQVSEEKLEEFRSRSEAETMESKTAQEEALRTVLEMMEKDCEDRVAELDTKLAQIEEERDRATQLQMEAAIMANSEASNKEELEEACRLAVEKLVRERQSRSLERSEREEREKELQRELEKTRQRLERESMTAGHVSIDNGKHQFGWNRSYSNDEESRSYDDSDSYGTRRSGESDASPMIPQDRVARLGVSSRTTSKRPPIINRSDKAESIFLNDPLNTMTRGRRIALSLQRFWWYQPRSKTSWDSKGLGLKTAWAHFEHSVLPRYIVQNADGTIPATANNNHENSYIDYDEEQENISVYEQSANESTIFEDEQQERFIDHRYKNDTNAWSDKPKPPKVYNNIARKQQKPLPQREMKNVQRAAPGESNLVTRLYSPFFTPLSQMGDFGIGVGLYFSSLRGVAVISFIAGLINIPNILYFSSEEYSASQNGVKVLLKGTAICTEQIWVPCPTCRVNDFESAEDRIAGATTVTPDGELQILVFAKKNTCDGATMGVGIINLATLGFIIIAMVALSLYQTRKECQFDEQEQTAQDYSIEIYNPPSDATEPEEWRDFFESRFSCHVTCCTVAINNDLLVKTLAERREVLMQVEGKVREGSSLNEMKLSQLAARVEYGRRFFGNVKARIAPGIPELVGRLTVLNARIRGLAQQEYVATRVFCMFETEKAQRQVLSEMMVGSIAAYRNHTHSINPNLLFRGEHVLLIREAHEPNTIRWMDLDENIRTRIKQVIITTFIGFACIIAVAVIVTLCHSISTTASAVAISFANAIFPIVAKILTNFETHSSESGAQSSLYIKIAIFRWVITAIVITIIMPFTSTLTNGPHHLIQSIFVIFFADIITTNAIQLVDPISNFNRHFLAPRASSQERMNLLMDGTEYTIAERYTNMTKTLFLTFYYCAIYPSAFFVCAVTLFVNYYVDKFSLMRTWKPVPMLGPYISYFSRTYFITIAIAAMAVMSAYFFSGFPYDNLCAEDVSHSAYFGTWQITDKNGHTSTAVISPGERSYQFCDQSLGPGASFAFPVGPEKQPSDAKWMTAEQEELTKIYGIISVSVLSLIGALFLDRFLRASRSPFKVFHKPTGKDQGISLSQNKIIASYIPQIRSDYFTHPLLAVHIDDIGENLFDWVDIERSHSYYDLTRDAEEVLEGNEDLCHKAFGRIRHWPPQIDDEEAKSAKSALKKVKDNGMGRNVTWSSKVTCKTYSKDTANNWDFFDANASSMGMNFDGHEPIYDPHIQGEARTFRGISPLDSKNNDNFANVQPHAGQNGNHDTKSQNNIAQQFDPYYNSGLDYENQLPDQMYGDSQNWDTNHVHQRATYMNNSEDRSYDQASASTGSSSDSQSDYNSLNKSLRPNETVKSQHILEQQYQDHSLSGTEESSRGSQYSDNPQPNEKDNEYGYLNQSENEFSNSGQSFTEEENEEENEEYWGNDDVNEHTESYSGEESAHSQESLDEEGEGLLPQIT